MEYILVKDNDCHWYVIPNDRRKHWSAWLELDSENERAWDVPEFAEEVGGSQTLVKFKEYRIE